jgi:hypothetical protein
MSLPLELETFSLSFSNESEKNITFDFSTIPQITATSDKGVNVYAEDISKTGCKIKTSSKITGTVYVHVMGYL